MSEGHSSTLPLTHVTVPPPTQIVPSPSTEMCTRPARPSAVPWLATYGAWSRPVPSSHCASEAFKLPVTGSSTVAPSFTKNAADLDRRRCAVGIRPDDAEAQFRRASAGHGEDGVGVPQQHRDPARTVVHPRGIDDVVATELEQFGDLLDHRLVDRP